MNNFRVYFKESVSLEINGEKMLFLSGSSVAFRNISNKDTKAIRKKAIKGDKITFTATGDTLGVYRVVDGNKNKATEDTIKESIKAHKGSKKDKFKNYTPKATSKKKQEPIEDTVDEQPIRDLDGTEEASEKSEVEQECVEITQNSLTDESENDIINTDESEVEINEQD